MIYRVWYRSTQQTREIIGALSPGQTTIQGESVGTLGYRRDDVLTFRTRDWQDAGFGCKVEELI